MSIEQDSAIHATRPVEYTPDVLEIENGLWLEKARMADSSDEFAMIAANREYLANAGEAMANYTLRDVLKYRIAMQNAMFSGRAAEYWIVQDEQKVGSVGMQMSAGVGERNVWVVEDAQDQGLATHAAGRLTDHVVATRGLHSVRAYIFPDNEKSLRRVKREGAQLIGQAKRDRFGTPTIAQIWEVHHRD